MSYTDAAQEDLIRIRDFPARSLIKLCLALTAAAVLGYMLLALLALAGLLPGGHVLGASGNVWDALLLGGFTAGATFFGSAIVAIVTLKVAARFLDMCNFALRIR
jgi:hypothetical protein